MDIRGNVETRLRKLAEQRLAGTVLAAAGLARLGLDRLAAFRFALDEMLPAVGQGALALEGRAGDARVRGLVGPLDHRPTALAVRAERALMRALQGGCQVPIAALAELCAMLRRARRGSGEAGGGVSVAGETATCGCGPSSARSTDATPCVTSSPARPSDPESLGSVRSPRVCWRPAASASSPACGPVAERPAKPLAGRVVVVTRPQAQAAALADPLAALGAEVLLVPTIRIEPTGLNDEIRAAVRAVGQYDLVVFTSANAVREFVARVHECGGTVRSLGGAPVAVVGPATAAAAREAGVEPALVAAGVRRRGPAGRLGRARRRAGRSARAAAARR